MKDVFKAVCFFVGLYILGLIFFTAIIYLFPLVLGLIVVLLIIMLIKSIKNG